MTRRKEPQSIAFQLAVAQRDLEIAVVERARLAYEDAQGVAGAAEALVSIEGEIAQFKLKIDRLEVAATVSKQVASVVDLEAEKALQAERIKRVSELNAEIEGICAQLVQHLAEMYPPLVRLESALRQRGTTAWQAVASPFESSKVAQKHIGGQFNRLMESTSTASVLLAAIRASGLGSIGSGLVPWVRLELSGAGSPEPALERMATAHGELLALLNDAHVIANAPPPTDDPEEIEETTGEEA